MLHRCMHCALDTVAIEECALFYESLNTTDSSILHSSRARHSLNFAAMVDFVECSRHNYQSNKGACWLESMASTKSENALGNAIWCRGSSKIQTDTGLADGWQYAQVLLKVTIDRNRPEVCRWRFLGFRPHEEWFDHCQLPPGREPRLVGKKVRQPSYERRQPKSRLLHQPRWKYAKSVLFLLVMKEWL